MRISDWSSDVCSSDLLERAVGCPHHAGDLNRHGPLADIGEGIGAARIVAEELAAALGREIIGFEPVLANQHRIERTATDIRDEAREVPRNLRTGDRKSTRLNSSQ